MNAFQDFWLRLDRGARLGLLLGALVIVGATLALGGFLLHTDYQVLFADLAQQDAATITAELDKMKQPYRLAADGNTILVPADQVLKTRLKLVGKELPLRGAVGLELFNSSEVGMTEFAQKVNFQRALQGELTRTILAIEEVQAVRVHLVLAEQGLFRKAEKKAKASIELATRPGRTLDAAQIQGIARLVSAAVPDIRPDDVTIVDQHGVALTRRAADGEDGLGADGLDDKRSLEAYLQKKVDDVLGRTFGPGQAIASVDVALGHEHSKVTTESVLGAGDGAAGIKVRERTSSRDGQAEPDPAHAAPGGLSTHEADYQVGRRVEQVVSGAGGISRINVAVVVRGQHDQEQLDRLKEVVALAAGINHARGDAVAVYAMDQMANAQVLPVLPAPPAAADPAPAPVGPAPARATPDASRGLLVAAVLAGLALLALAAALLARSRARRARPLTHEERRLVLEQVNHWLGAAPAVSAMPAAREEH
ncbi:MAG: flagellar basal-body MS-ring/collar protein FliF [Telluria sp.]